MFNWKMFFLIYEVVMHIQSKSQNA